MSRVSPWQPQSSLDADDRCHSPGERQASRGGRRAGSLQSSCGLLPARRDNREEVATFVDVSHPILTRRKVIAPKTECNQDITPSENEAIVMLGNASTKDRKLGDDGKHLGLSTLGHSTAYHNKYSDGQLVSNARKKGSKGQIASDLSTPSSINRKKGSDGQIKAPPCESYSLRKSGSSGEITWLSHQHGRRGVKKGSEGEVTGLTFSYGRGRRPKKGSEGEVSGLITLMASRRNRQRPSVESDHGEQAASDKHGRDGQLLKKLREKHRKTLYMRFRTTARMAIYCARVARAYILRNKVYDDISPYISGLHFRDFETNDIGVELLFDPSRFKADKQLRMSEEAKRILSKPPGERTEKEIYYSQLAMRNITAFTEYPVRMQRRIVEVGRYAKYDTKRVIVRQGHVASAFYFILSGSVVVMVSDSVTNMAQPVAHLHKGRTFGELAIINRTTRQSTCIAKETLELLSIDIEDYHRIFMAGGIRNIYDPDHNSFLRGLMFLSGWPLHLMAERPKDCIFLYFKNDDILVKDSNYSDWIYIVKSGSLRVLKKLKRVKPRIWSKREFLAPGRLGGQQTERQRREARERHRQETLSVLSQLRLPLKSLRDEDDTDDDLIPESDQDHVTARVAEEEEDCRENRVNRGHNASGEQRNVGRPRGQGRTARAPLLPALGQALKDDLPRRPHSVARIKGHTPSRGQRRQAKRPRGKVPNVVADVDEDPSSSEISDSEYAVSSSRDRRVTSAIVNLSHKSMAGASGKAGNKGNKRPRPSMKGQAEEEAEELGGKRPEIRTIAHDFNAPIKLKGEEDMTAADRDPEFVHIQTLTKGQAFGIPETVVGAQPSFCVLSNGAECILLRKSLYLEHAPDELLRNVVHECSPYPSDEDMQQELQVSVDWSAYKMAMFQGTMRTIQRHHRRLQDVCQR